MPIRTRIRGPIRAALLVALGVAPLLAACAGRGAESTGPLGGALVRRGEEAPFVGRWTYLLEHLKNEPLLGGVVVADTIVFRPAGKGDWIRVTLDPLDAGRQQRAVVPFDWSPVEGHRVSLWFSCEPRELCDPLPGWTGGISIEGQLEIRSVMPSAADRVRIYGKLEDR